MRTSDLFLTSMDFPTKPSLWLTKLNSQKPLICSQSSTTYLPMEQFMPKTLPAKKHHLLSKELPKQWKINSKGSTKPMKSIVTTIDNWGSVLWATLITMPALASFTETSTLFYNKTTLITMWYTRMMHRQMAQAKKLNSTYWAKTLLNKSSKSKLTLPKSEWWKTSITLSLTIANLTKSQ